MNTAQPQSFPPGVSGSGGISRSTKASTVSPSCGVKKCQPPGVAGDGGLADPGCHGRAPLITVARAAGDTMHNASAVDPKSCRRLTRCTGFKSCSAAYPATRDSGGGSAAVAFEHRSHPQPTWLAVEAVTPGDAARMKSISAHGKPLHARLPSRFSHEREGSLRRQAVDAILRIIPRGPCHRVSNRNF